MRRLIGCCFLLSVFSFNVSIAVASGGKVAGRVYDQQTEELLPGANIYISDIWKTGKEVPIETIRGASSDLDGYFVILNVPPGTYTVHASMVGYREVILRQVRVNLDLTTVLDIMMETTVLETEEIEVIAPRELIRKDVSGTQEIILSDRLNNTPVLRVDEFMNKIKGVDLVATSDGQGLSIRGGAIRETDVRLDDISLRDPRSGNSYLSFNSTAVEELQILTGGFEAKYGGIRSGLVNVVSKEGSENRYNVSLKFDYSIGDKHKYFGTDPWSTESWIYKVFADTNFKYYNPATDEWLSYAMDGVPEEDSLLHPGFPEELRFFRGWNHRAEGRSNYQSIGLPTGARLSPESKRDLWLIQHPLYTYADKPDYFIEGTITGPLPGGGLPLIGGFLKNTTFLIGGKFEDSQFAFPLGPKNDYKDWNAQVKLTTRLNPSMKLSISGMYAKIASLTAGQSSTFGGALIDNSNRFNFLSSTSVSVDQQASLLGGSNGFIQMFNKSRLQYYDQRYIIGGARFSHTISPKSFYTADLQFSYTDFEVTPFGFDPLNPNAYVPLDTFRVLNVPELGSPNASTNWLTDLTNFFWLYGGLQVADTSYSWAVNFKGNYTTQLGRHHQVETGFNLYYNYLSVNTGTWLQSEKSWTPDTWQYFTVQPIEIGIYAQDKLEFEGMVANIGLRIDYFNANKDAFVVAHPLDQSYADFYNLIYQNLAGKFGSWEKWVEYRKMLEQPPGWPTSENKAQITFSPRVGISFPVTESSKLYFNYGHFYQPPNIHFLYNLSISPGSAIVPSTGLTMAKTIAYEFGFEQRFLETFLINVSFYYKDIKDEPLNRTYIDYNEELYVNQYFPDRYRDIRGFELRLERNIGQFFTFWGNYEYMLQSYGSSGLARVYENRLKALEESRNPNITITEPRPRANMNAALHTPYDWGPKLDGYSPLGGFVVNFLFEWRDGGEQIINPYEPEDKQKKIEVVDFWNVDLRASKIFRFADINFDVVLTIQNLFNIKRLSYWNMSTAQFDRYRESLHFPFESGDQHGEDKLGDWDKEYIDIGWFTAPLFLNPRRILLGLRFYL